MSNPPPVSRTLTLAVRWACALVAVWQFWVHGVAWPLSMHGVDFTVLWRSALAILGDRSVYEEPIRLAGPPDHWEVFKYPQFLAVICSWLGWMAPKLAETIWKLLMISCVLGCLPIFAAWQSRMRAEEALEQIADPLRRFVLDNWFYLFVLVLASFTPATSAIALGQVGPLLLLAGVAFAFCSVARHDVAAGLLWALLCLVKVTPVLLVVPLLLWGRWRTLVAATALFLLYGVMLALTGRVGEEWRYVRDVAPQIPYLCSRVSMSHVQWVAVAFAPSSLVDPGAYSRIAQLVSAVLVSVYLLVMVAQRRARASFDHSLATAIVGLLVVSPVLEFHHFVSVFPALLLQCRIWLEGRIAGWRMGLMALAWAPIAGAGCFVAFNSGFRGQLTLTAAMTVLFVLSWARDDAGMVIPAPVTEPETHRQPQE